MGIPGGRGWCFTCSTIIRIWPPGSCLLYHMIQIFLCKLTDGEWRRVERHHTTRGFASMLEATEFAEALNAKTWERFDWIKEPREAFLAFRE